MATTRTVIQRYLLPRQLHPVAWWGYALAIKGSGVGVIPVKIAKV